MASSGKKPARLVRECGPKCRSKQHALQLIQAVTKGNQRQIQLFCCTCNNPGLVSDRYSRTVLHVAASCGKWQLVQWLLEECRVDVGAKDLESGWTALHRALFYGQLSVARLLISNGSSLHVRDKEGLMPLDVAMKDRLPYVEFVQSGLQEVYTWGDNSNFTLGHDSMQRKRHPEMVEILRKAGVSIKQVVMCKYHSIFLSTAGQVYTCGHGLGGRLGHGNEKTCLVPTLVESLQQEECVAVAAARDHTIMLMASGTLFSCGLNDCHQLGHFLVCPKSLLPKQVTGKALKGRSVKGMCAQRFHTVIYTNDAVFTFGLNAGQLGHMKVAGEKIVGQPRQVSALNHKDMKIKLVAAADAATVVVTLKGDVYALHEYQCRKITSKRLDIVQVAVSGGHLDHNLEMGGLYERGGSELVIALLNMSGQVHMWRESDSQLKHCSWLIKRPLAITQIAVSVHSIAFVTHDGEAFVAPIPKVRESREVKDGHAQVSPTAAAKESLYSSSHVDSFSKTLTDLLEQEDITDLRLEKVPMVHRATAIATDRKGHNFAVLQSQPNACLTEIPSTQTSEMAKQFQTLLDEADAMDLIHDAILQVGTQQIATHRFILASRSDYFQKMFCQKSEDSVVADDKPVVVIENADVDLFLQLLKFIYTDTCDLLKVGDFFKWGDVQTEAVTGAKTDKIGIELDLSELSHFTEFVPGRTSHGGKVSAFQVYQEGKKTKGKKKTAAGNKGGREKGDKEKDKKDDSMPLGGNPIKMLQDLAKKYGVKSLAKRLEAVKWIHGSIQPVVGRSLPSPRLNFDRWKFPMLHDVGIKSQDGVTVPCHKSVLVARLEYFHSMLASGWIETSRTDALTLPVPADILTVVLDYLYSDEAPSLAECEDPEFLCNILVVADQLLIGRLKDICEVAIASLISLKTATELLELASLYNATQLKTTCQQFITINLPALLETRSLDVLSDDVLEELTAYYRDTVPGMSRRRITPYDGWPDRSFLETLEADHSDLDISGMSADPGQEETSTRKQGSKPKRRRTRTKSTEEETPDKHCSDSEVVSQRPERQISVSSDAGFSIDLEDLTEEESALQSPREQIAKAQIPDSRSKRRPQPSLIIPPRAEWPKPWGVQSVQSPEAATGEAVAQSPTSPHPGADRGSSSQGLPPGFPGGSLREIMEQQSSQARKQPQSAQQKQASGGKKHTHKLSQKERKKLQSQLSENDTMAAAVDGAQMNAGKSKAWSSNPWGTTDKVVQSFKDLMLDEKQQGSGSVATMATSPIGKQPAGFRERRTSESGSRRERTYSFGLPNMTPKSPQSPPASRGEGDNPWQRVTVAQPVTPTKGASGPGAETGEGAVAFSEIMQDEIKQRETLQRATNKPLALIQMEEQAIQELLCHYKAAETVDEIISVERVPTRLARPTWAATQRQ